MKDPLSSMPFLDTCMNYKNQPLEQLVYTMFKDINYYSVNMDQDYQFTTNLSELTDIIAKRIKISHENENRLLMSFTGEEIKYLQANMFSLFVNSDQDAPENFDIYKLDAAEDSSNAVSKRTMDILSKADTILI